MIMLIAVIFPVICNATDYTWTGAVNNNWSEPGNWTSTPTGTYPVSGTDNAVIPGGKANYPVLTSPSVYIRDLIIENGASFTVNSSSGSEGFYAMTSAVVNGSLRLDRGYFKAEKNTVGNGGIITVSSGGFFIGMDGAVIAAGGILALNGGETVFDYDSTLENNGTVTISGGNLRRISINYCVITNNSLMEITGNASGENWSFTNNPGGTFVLKPGSMLNISSDSSGKFDNYGTVTGSGVLKFTPLPLPNPYSPPPPFKNFGTVKPGGPLNIGTLTIDDKYEQMPGGSLEIEISNSAVYDRLSINGDAGFNGTLAVSFLAGATFGTDEIYDMVSYTGTNFGTSFSSPVLPTLPGYRVGPVDYNAPGFVKLPIRNSPPTTSGIPPVIVNEDAPLSSLKLSDFFDDVESGPPGLIYTIQSDANPKPFTASISGESLTLSYNPNANGTAKLTIRAKDPGGLYVDTDLSVSVNPVNDKPDFTVIGNPPATDEDAGLQTINWVTSFSPGPPNESGQTPTYLIRNVSNKALFSNLPEITSNGVLTYRAASDISGTSDFEVAVKDNGGVDNGGVDTSDFRKFTIIVNPVNDPPSFEAENPPEINEDAEQQIINGWAKFTPGPPDEAAQKPDYSVTNISNKALFSEVPQIDGNGTLTYKPAPNAFGTSTFDVFVKDDGGGKDTSDPQTFTISVKAVNDPPVIIRQKPLSALQGTSFTLEVDHLVIDDPDNIFPSDFKVTVYEGDNYILKADTKDTFIPYPDFTGKLTVPVTVSDRESESEIFYLSVTVKSDNHPPVAGSGNALNLNGQKRWISVNSSPSLELGNLLTFEAWVRLNPKSASGSDLDTDHIILSKGNEYVFGISEADTNTDGIPDGRVFVGPPDNPVFLKLSDNMADEYDKWHHVAVTFDGENLILYIDGRQAGEKNTAEYTLPAESSTLSIGARISSDGIVTGILNGTIDEVRIWNAVRSESDIRKYMYRKVSKEDESNLAGYWKFDLDTDMVVFDASGNRNNGILNYTGTTTLPAWVKSDCYGLRRVKEDSVLNIFSGYDPDGDSLGIYFTDLPSDGSLSFDDTTGEITYRPDSDWNGEDLFAYRLSDGNPSDVYTIHVRVEAENDPPVFDSKPVISVNEGETYQYDIEVSDPDAGDNLTIIAIGALPDWLELNENDDVETHGRASLQGKPENKDVGEYPITLQVTDGQSDPVSQTFTISVKNVNNAPVLDNSKDSMLDSIAEDISESDNIGTLISDMIAEDTISDADTDALQGIAVIAADRGNGVWQYAKDGDTDFIAFPSDIAENKAVLLNGNMRLRFVPNKNYYGNADITFRAWDQTYGSNGDTGADTVNNGDMTPFSINTAKAVIEVKAANDTPVANNDDYHTAEDSLLKIDSVSGVLANDRDVENDVLTAIKITEPVNGSLTLNADGSFEYLPSENFSGQDSFTYKVNDGTQDSNTATAVISVSAVNDVPAATDDSFSVEEDEALIVPSPGILKNDSDAEGDSLKAAKIGDPIHGSLTVNSDGSFSYRPNADFFGEDSFTYKVNDSISDSNTATVTVSVTAVNDVPIISGTPEIQVDEDTSYYFMPNAEDSDKDTLSFSIVNKPAWADFDSSTGTLSGTPHNEDVGTSENIVISVSDGTAASSLPAFNLTVVNINDAPGISGTPATKVNADSQYSFTPLASDADGDVLTFSIDNKPAWAKFDTETGELRGIPGAKDVGVSKNIVISVSDGKLTAALPAFRITVVRISVPPDAKDDRYETEEDQPLTIQAPGILANDIAIEGDYELNIEKASQGRTTLNHDGSFRYTPTENYNGEDQFTYKVIKGDESDTAIVTIIVKPVNDSPVLNTADMRLSSIAEDAAETDNFGTTVADILASADHPISDADKDAKSGIAVIAADTAHGVWQYANPEIRISSMAARVFVNFPEDIAENKAVLLDSTAMIRFVPDADFNGTSAITFRAWDQTQGNSGDSNSDTSVHGGTTAFSSEIGKALITVNPVNDMPLFTSIPVTAATEDSNYSYMVTTADPDADDVHSITAPNLPGWLSLSDKGDGTALLAGTPKQSNMETYDVMLTVTDAAGTWDTQTFTIRIINVNNQPVFNSRPVRTATEGDVYVYTVETADPDTEDTLLITARMLPVWLNFTDNGDGTALLSGTPGNEDVGEHTVGLSVRDAAGITASQSFTIAVANVNNPPKITGTPVTAASENSDYVYFITATDPDAGDRLSITTSDLPKWLSLTDNGDGTARLSGTPADADAGEHSVSLRVKDTTGETDTQSFKITVTNVNEPPIFTGTPMTDATEDAMYIYSITTSDADTGDSLTIKTLKIPVWLSLTDNRDGTAKLAGIPADSDIGSHSIALEVRDRAGAADVQAFEITVANVNDAPIITGQNPLSTSEETALTITLNDLTVSDPDNEYPIDFRLTVQNSMNYTHEGNTLIPMNGFSGILTVPVTVNDGTDDSNVFDLNIVVSPVAHTRAISGRITGLAAGNATEITVSSLSADFSKEIILQGTGEVMSYVVTDLKPAADYRIEIRSETYLYLEYADFIDVTDHDADSIDFTLVAATTVISGRLIFPENAVPGETVSIEAFSESRGTRESVQIVFQNLREIPYTVKGLIPAGDYIVSVWSDRYNHRYYDGTATGTANENDAKLLDPSDPDFPDISFELELSRGGSIQGTISDEAGNPLSGVEIKAWSESRQEGNSSLSKTDGSYDIEGLPESRDYTVSVLPDSSMPYLSQEKPGISTGDKVNFVLEQKSSPNSPPVITGQKTLEVEEGTSLTVRLNDLSITDPDNVFPDDFRLRIKDGENYIYSDTTITPSPGFYGSLTVPIIVNDGVNDSNVFYLEVKVSRKPNTPPTADAGADQTVNDGQVVTLDGSKSFDPDDGIVSYFWEQIGVPSVTLSDSASVQPTFIASGTESEELLFQLTVTDSTGQSSQDTCMIRIVVQSDNTLPDIPFAVSPANEAVLPSESVMLQAGAFSDPDGDVHTATHWLIRRADREYSDAEKDPSFDYIAESGDLTRYMVTGLISGMKYAWKAGYKDSGSNSFSWSEEYIFKIGVLETDATVSIDPGDKAPDYRMVSFPLWPDNPASEAVLGDDLGGNYDRNNFRIGTYHPEIGNYAEYGNQMDIEPGIAYWFLARNGLDITVTGVPVSVTTDIDVRLRYDSLTGNGWNMIGCPNDADYYWNEVKVIVCNSDGMTIYGPVALADLPEPNPYLHKQLWRWENGDYASDTEWMESYKGYWVKAKAENVYLRFPANGSRNLETRIGKGLNRFISNFQFSIFDFQLREAFAYVYDDDSPPRPMENLTLSIVKENGSSRVEASGGCFISDSADNSSPVLFTLTGILLLLTAAVVRAVSRPAEK